MAARFGCEDVINQLILAGADIEARNKVDIVNYDIQY